VQKGLKPSQPGNYRSLIGGKVTNYKTPATLRESNLQPMLGSTRFKGQKRTTGTHKKGMGGGGAPVACGARKGGRKEPTTGKLPTTNS